jgi:transposase
MRTMTAGDLPTLVREIQLAKARFGLPLDAPVRSCYEAGRDGFWLHRWLIAQAVENVVVDSSSIEVNRRARRAKTDRLDVGKLLALLLRWFGGERKVWSVVHVPAPEAEAQRQLTREIATVREDRKRVRNRIQALLATQGIRLELRTGFVEHLATVQTGDGRPLPMAFRFRLAREWSHLDAIEARMTALTAARDEQIATGSDRVAAVARQLCTAAAWPRPVRRCSAPSSSARARFAMAGKSGRCWDGCPSHIGVTNACRTRGSAKPAARSCGGKRIGIVALARKLAIALWRYVEHGVVPEGATLKA